MMTKYKDDGQEWSGTRLNFAPSFLVDVLVHKYDSDLGFGQKNLNSQGFSFWKPLIWN